MGSGLSVEEAQRLSTSSNADKRFQVPNSEMPREISWADAGDPCGFPLVYLPGLGGSRFMALMLHDEARQLGVRLLALDAPGFGNSTAVEERTMEGWMEDVDKFTSIVLGADTQFAVFGQSIGGLAVLSAAATPNLRERIRVAIAFCPWVPVDAPGVQWSTRQCRWLPRWTLGLGARVTVAYMNSIMGGGRFVTALTPSALGPEEKRHLEQLSPGSKELIRLGSLDANKQGKVGTGTTILMCCSRTKMPLKLNFEEVKVKKIRVYHGFADRMVTVRSTEWMVEELRRCSTSEVQFIQIDDGTHPGLTLTHGADALRFVAKECCDLSPKMESGQPTIEWMESYQEAKSCTEWVVSEGHETQQILNK